MSKFEHNTWYRYPETPPEPGQPVLGYSPEWEEEDEVGEGVRDCYMQEGLTDTPYWLIAAYCNSCDEYHTRYTKEYYSDEEIAKIEKDYGSEGSLVTSIKVIQPAPTHWMLRPEKPKDNFGDNIFTYLTQV